MGYQISVDDIKTLSERLAYARVWGGKIDGQRVARDFELRDRDVVELAT